MQPRFQCTTLHSSKILNKSQSLKQNVQYIALKKVKSTEIKKSVECTIHSWSMHHKVHVAQLSSMFFVWPVSTSVTVSGSGSKVKPQ